MTRNKRFTLLCSSLSLFAACAAPDDAPEPESEPGDEPAEIVMARAHLVAAAPEIAVADLEVTRNRRDELGMTHVRQQQLVDGIPVIGGEAIVHMQADGTLSAVTDKLARDVAVDTTPAISSAAAIEKALAATVGAGQETAPTTADLRILRDDGVDRLVWQVAIESLPETDPDAWTKPLVHVDAHSGDVVRSAERILSVNANATGSSRYDGTVSFKTWFDDVATYYLEDNVRKVGVFDLNGSTSDSGAVARYIDNDNNWTQVHSAVSVHWGLEKVWDYFHNTFSREGIDGNYGPGKIDAKSGQGKLVSGYVHWGNENARWVDPHMAFGDGGGTLFSNLVSLDIVAHEWGHGVVSRTAGLGGSGESPALNEHFGDVFGAAVEAYVYGVSGDTWKIGEDAYTPGTAGDALRYMDDPAKDNVTWDYWTSDLDTTDEHNGAGPGNLAFYLVVNGGDHPRRVTAHVTGVGLDKAQRVWYRALDTYLTSDASYSDLRTATLLAAKDLYGAGGATYRALHSAWEAVGLLSVSTPGFSEVRTGSLTTGQAAIWPSTSGFSSDGSIIGFLGYDFADDFDLELWKLNTSTNTWSKVDDAVGPGNNEVVGYSGTAGQYRWRVKATSGSGGYSLGWNP
jgi:Zn-dependent metalloprotease